VAATVADTAAATASGVRSTAEGDEAEEERVRVIICGSAVSREVLMHAMMAAVSIHGLEASEGQRRLAAASRAELAAAVTRSAIDPMALSAASVPTLAAKDSAFRPWK
jgi:hypothetical protein